MSSLSDQIEELEEELYDYQNRASQLSNDLNEAEHRISDLEYDCEEMGKFIEYVDATHPELRVAYEAAMILKGDTP
jgi:predicted  nucleic acid-binding Zn-ribbon protein